MNFHYENIQLNNNTSNLNEFTDEEIREQLEKLRRIQLLFKVYRKTKSFSVKIPFKPY